VPGELADLVAAYVRAGNLVPVAVLRTRRQVVILRAEDGRELAEVALDDVTGYAASVLGSGDLTEEQLDGARPLVRFRELEVEDRDNRQGELDDVVRALHAAGASPGVSGAKVERVLGPLAQAGPDVAVPRPVGPDEPAGHLVTAFVAAQVRALRQADLGVRRDQDDAVHQMRVAARRLRSGLHVFRPLLEDGPAEWLRAELAWIAAQLGQARDSEVLVRRLDLAVAQLPDGIEPLAARTLIDTRLGADTAAARTAALDALHSPRYAALLEQLIAAAAAPATTEAAGAPCRVALPPLVAHAWRRLDRDATALRLDGVDDEWHEARKAAKKARYAAEAVAPALGKPAKALARQVERVTELLGEHQDAAVAADALAALAADGESTSRAGFALGLLYQRQRNAVQDSRTGFLRLWPEVADKKHRRWLTAR
jgi:CHAD domain-containing protein